MLMLIHPIKMCDSDSEWVLVLNDDLAGPQKTCDLSGQRFVYLGDCLMLWFHHTDQRDKVSIIVEEVYNDVTYHCSHPLFHHEWCQGYGITCDGINICISGIMIICIFLLKYSPETSQFKLKL